MCYFFTSTVKQCLCKTLIIILVRKYFSNFVSVCRPVSLSLSVSLSVFVSVSVCVSIGPSLSLSVSVCVCVCVYSCAVHCVCAETLNGPTSSLVDVICILTVPSRVEKG